MLFLTAIGFFVLSTIFIHEHLFAMAALAVKSFGCPRWVSAAVFAGALFSLCGSGLDIYTLAKLRCFNSNWTALDQGDRLILRRPP